MRKGFLIAVLIVWWIIPATAYASKPAELQGVIAAENPVGKARLEWMWMHVYDAEIWTDAPQWSYQNSFALSITYQFSFTTEELVEKTLDEMKRLHNVDAERLQRYKPQIETAFPNVKKGDRITASYDAKTGATQFYHNGKKTGIVTERAFAVPFFDIWLSDNSEYPDVTQQLKTVLR